MSIGIRGTYYDVFLVMMTTAIMMTIPPILTTTNPSPHYQTRKQTNKQKQTKQKTKQKKGKERKKTVVCRKVIKKGDFIMFGPVQLLCVRYLLKTAAISSVPYMV